MNTDIALLLRAQQKNSTCERRSIGAVITDAQGRFCGLGSNGPMVGPCDCPTKDAPAGSGAGCYGTHAEIYALFDCARRKKLYEAHTLYSTKAPCHECVPKLLGTPIQRIVFFTPSNETRNREMWEGAGREWVWDQALDDTA